jgi:hypothetical protein
MMNEILAVLAVWIIETIYVIFKMQLTSHTEHTSSQIQSKRNNITDYENHVKYICTLSRQNLYSRYYPGIWSVSIGRPPCWHLKRKPQEYKVGTRPWVSVPSSSSAVFCCKSSVAKTRATWRSSNEAELWNHHKACCVLWS